MKFYTISDDNQCDLEQVFQNIFTPPVSSSVKPEVRAVKLSFCKALAGLTGFRALLQSSHECCGNVCLLKLNHFAVLKMKTDN